MTTTKTTTMLEMVHLYSPETLRDLRNRSLLTMRDAQRESGVHRNTIWKLENDRRVKGPLTSTLRRLLSAYARCIGELERQQQELKLKEEKLKWKPFWQSPSRAPKSPRPSATT